MFKDSLYYTYDSISDNILSSDLIIVATTSDGRYGVCQELLKLGYEGNLILEKFLFPNYEFIEKSTILLNNFPGKIFVNQWMRKTKLINILNHNSITNISITGKNLGILSNAVHYIDLIAIDRYDIFSRLRHRLISLSLQHALCCQKYWNHNSLSI